LERGLRCEAIARKTGPAIRGLNSSGLAARAIEHSSEEAVTEARALPSTRRRNGRLKRAVVRDGDASSRKAHQGAHP
jgi:hypothetical protein